MQVSHLTWYFTLLYRVWTVSKSKYPTLWIRSKGQFQALAASPQNFFMMYVGHNMLWNRDDISRYVLICTSYTLNCTIPDYNRQFSAKTVFSPKTENALAHNGRRGNFLQKNLYSLLKLVYSTSTILYNTKF